MSNFLTSNLNFCSWRCWGIKTNCSISGQSINVRCCQNWSFSFSFSWFWNCSSFIYSGFLLTRVDGSRFCTLLCLVFVFAVVVLREVVLCIRSESEWKFLDNFLWNVFLKLWEYIRNNISVKRCCVFIVQKSNLLFRLREKKISRNRTTVCTKFKRVDCFQSQTNE